MYGHPKCIFSVMRVIAGLRRREITGMVNTNCINRILQLSSIGIHTSSCRLGIDKFPRGRLTVPESQEKVEISTVEWSFVERVLPMKSIPVPTAKPGEVMPSGWNAPSAKPGDYPYHVIRNANHMLPVYVEHVAILTRFTTLIRNVEGDIFKLGEELKEHLERLHSRGLAGIQVHEPQRRIIVRGNHYTAVRDFLLKKGF